MGTSYDSLFNCPITGEHCPYRESFEKTFDTIEVITEGRASDLEPGLDGPKLIQALGSHAERVREEGCRGVIEGVCPNSHAERVPRGIGRRLMKRLQHSQ